MPELEILFRTTNLTEDETATNQQSGEEEPDPCNYYDKHDQRFC